MPKWLLHFVVDNNCLLCDCMKSIYQL